MGLAGAWAGGGVQKHSCRFVTNHTSSADVGKGGRMSPPLPNSGSVSKQVVPREDSRKEPSHQPTGHPLQAAAASWGSDHQPREKPPLSFSAPPSAMSHTLLGCPDLRCPSWAHDACPTCSPILTTVSSLPFLLPNTPSPPPHKLLLTSQTLSLPLP